MPLLRLLDADGGTQLRGERLLVLDEEQTCEDIQIGCHRLHVDILVVDLLDIVFQRLV